MRKIKPALVCGVLMTLLLVACAGRGSDGDSVPEEIQVPEEALIDTSETVEKLLNKEDIIDIPAVEESVSEEAEAVSDDIAPPLTVTVFYVKGDYSEFCTEEYECPNSDFKASFIMEKLATHNIVPVDCKINSVETQENENGDVCVYLDVTDSFDKYLDTMSDIAHDSIVNSVVNTFLLVYEADEIQISSEGKAITLSGSDEEKLHYADVPVITE